MISTAISTPDNDICSCNLISMKMECYVQCLKNSNDIISQLNLELIAIVTHPGFYCHSEFQNQ